MADPSENSLAHDDFISSLVAWSKSIDNGSADQGNIVGVDGGGKVIMYSGDANTVFLFVGVGGKRVRCLAPPNATARLFSKYNLLVIYTPTTVQLTQLNTGNVLFADFFFGKNGAPATWSNNVPGIIDAAGTPEHIVLVFDTGQVGLINWKDEFLLRGDATTRRLIASDRKIQSVQVDARSQHIVWCVGRVPFLMYIRDIERACVVAPLHHPVLPWSSLFDPVAEFDAVNTGNGRNTSFEVPETFDILGVSAAGCHIAVVTPSVFYVIDTAAKSVTCIDATPVAIDVGKWISIITMDGRMEVWTHGGTKLVEKEIPIPTFRWSNNAVAERSHSTVACVNNLAHVLHHTF